MRILVIDDNAQVRKMLSSFLMKNRHQVISAKDGKEGWEIIKEEDSSLDLIFADVKMPVMNGLELLEKIRQNELDIPIIIMTGYAVIELTLKAFKLGAFDFLTKPFEFDSLLVTLDKVESLKSTKLDLLEITKDYKASIHYAIPSHTKYLKSVIPALHAHYKPLCELVGNETHGIGSSLFEVIQNAIVYGNLGVSSSIREKSLEKFLALLKKRQVDPLFFNKRVTIDAELSAEKLIFTVQDEGSGFDTSSLPDYYNPDSLMPSGRGLFIVHSHMDEVQWNETGNTITLVKYLNSQSV